MQPAEQFVLGTVQFGMTYGIANQSGTPADGAALMSEAHELGIGTLDTAQAYGSSETVIGNELRAHPDYRFAIVSKIAPSVDADDPAAVHAAASETRERLGRIPDILMYHDAAVVQRWGDRAGKALMSVRDAGLCGRTGTSVYTPEEFSIALESDGVDVIQAPLNMLDLRLVRSGLLDRALDRGIEVHVRSVFLQGLLLMNEDALPDRMQDARPWIAGLNRICRDAGTGMASAAVGFVRSLGDGLKLVIGCDTVEQLRLNFSLFNETPMPAEISGMIANLDPAPENLVNPALWPR
jgi:aryl-alcohol dehydrogenase-like predicted oxidoreductase